MNLWLVTLIILLLFIYIIIKIVEAYMFWEIKYLVTITNAFLTTALIFFTSKAYEIAKFTFENGLMETIKVLIQEGFPPSDLGAFLFITNIFLLLVLILCCVTVNIIPQVINSASNGEYSIFTEKHDKTKNWIIGNARLLLGIAVIISVISIIKILTI